MLHTTISNHSWKVWQQTTQFIVDSFHYINQDYIAKQTPSGLPPHMLTSVAMVVADAFRKRLDYDAKKIS